MNYYDTCPFPKPGSKKKKLLTNGYKDKHKRCCVYCGESGAERHEVFGGSNRQISIREDFQVDVCSAHHRELQDNITDWAQAENSRLRQKHQNEWVDKLVKTGVPKEKALSAWKAMIGRFYA